MPRQRTFASPSHSASKDCSSEKAQRSGKSDERQSKYQAKNSVPEYVSGATSLNHVILIHQFSIPTAKRDAGDGETLPLKRKYFSPNESMADFGVLIHKVRNVH